MITTILLFSIAFAVYAVAVWILAARVQGVKDRVIFDHREIKSLLKECLGQAYGEYKIIEKKIDTILNKEEKESPSTEHFEEWMDKNFIKRFYPKGSVLFIRHKNVGGMKRNSIIARTTEEVQVIPGTSQRIKTAAYVSLMDDIGDKTEVYTDLYGYVRAATPGEVAYLEDKIARKGIKVGDSVIIGELPTEYSGIGEEKTRGLMKYGVIGEVISRGRKAFSYNSVCKVRFPLHEIGSEVLIPEAWLRKV